MPARMPATTGFLTTRRSAGADPGEDPLSCRVRRSRVFAPELNGRDRHGPEDQNVEDDEKRRRRHCRFTEPELQNRNPELHVVAEDACHREDRAASRRDAEKLRVEELAGRKEHEAAPEKRKEHAPVDGRHLGEVAQHVEEKRRHQKAEREGRERRGDVVAEKMRLSQPPADEDQKKERRAKRKLMKEKRHDVSISD